MELKIHVDVHFPRPAASGFETTVLQLINILTNKVNSVMSTQAQLVEQLNTVTTSLSAIGAEVDKVSGETTALLSKITELQNALNDAGSTTPEVDSALAAVVAQAQLVASKLQAVDDLVPDAPTGSPPDAA